MKKIAKKLSLTKQTLAKVVGGTDFSYAYRCTLGQDCKNQPTRICPE